MRPCTVVIPTYNEAENLEPIILALWALELNDLKVLVVDDDSPDGTGQIADELAQAYPGKIDVLHRKQARGLGRAYIAGFRRALEAGAQAIAQMDADFSHAPSYLPGLIEILDGADAALGSRYVPGGRLDEHWGVARVLLSGFGNLYARLILGLDVRDATGGYRVWRRETLLGMPLGSIRSNGYVFQVEMAYVAQRLGYTIQESPIYFEERRVGESKMSLRISMEAALRVWQLRWIHRNLKQG